MGKGGGLCLELRLLFEGPAPPKRLFSAAVSAIKPATVLIRNMLRMCFRGVH